MGINIKEKNRYDNLVDMENRRDIRNIIGLVSFVFIVGIGIIVLAIGASLLIGLGLNKMSGNLDGVKPEYVFYSGIALVIIFGMIETIDYIISKKKNDDLLKILYKYLPLDREDINNNGLSDYLEYLMCIHKLIKEVTKDYEGYDLELHERVRHDILEVMKEVYVLNDSLGEVLKEHLETLVNKCDTREKMKKLINYYMREQEWDIESKNIKQEFGL